MCVPLPRSRAAGHARTNPRFAVGPDPVGRVGESARSGCRRARSAGPSRCQINSVRLCRTGVTFDPALHHTGLPRPGNQHLSGPGLRTQDASGRDPDLGARVVVLRVRPRRRCRRRPGARCRSGAQNRRTSSRRAPVAVSDLSRLVRPGRVVSIGVVVDRVDRPPNRSSGPRGRPKHLPDGTGPSNLTEGVRRP
jgi:hypothetical protein